MCSAYLAEVREAYPQYTGIGTVLPTGQLHCDSLRSGRVLNPGDRAYFNQARGGGRRGADPGAVFGRITGNSVLQIVFPARAGDGGLCFLLVASLNLQQFAAEARQQSLLPASELLLVGQPRHVLVAVSKRRLRQGLVVLTGAALLLFVGVWTLAEWGIRRQVARVTSMVSDLGAGNLTARIALPYPRGELGGLMAVLNRTAESLQQQRQAIDELAARLNAAQTREIAVRAERRLERNEFVLHYQPTADLGTGRVIGVEALLRWQPAGQAMVAPDQFITILEETGLIVPVGAWVLREACGQMMQWQGQGMRPLTLALNLSARRFRHQDLAGQVAEVLARAGFDPAQLEVELAESMLIDDSEPVVRIMTELAAMGVSIAIDDFGTGHSSLRYLQRFHVNTLMIDRSFVKDTPGDPENSAIAMAVIALGHGLGLHVVAEGVETAQQVDFLRSRGCDEFQGFLLSRPLAAQAFTGWLARHEAAQADAV